MIFHLNGLRREEDKSNKMQMLITGGAGFMGSNFIKYILKKYPAYKVINIDKLTYAGNLENLKEVENNPNYRFVRGDIADEEIISKVFRENKIDVVINFAAETHVDRSIHEPKAFLFTDIIGTYTLLEAVKKYKTERMIQISTDEVYGSTKDGKFSEETPFDPSSPYSASKASADHMCSAYFKTFNTQVIIIHSCNFFGPNQYPEKLIPLFITNLLEGKKVPVYGKGDQVREWIFTEDFCNAVDILLHNGKTGETYNIGSGIRLKNIEITKKMLSLLGKDSSYIEYVKDRPGHDFRYAINSNKFRMEFNYESKYTFDDALKITVEWYKNNESWWKKIKSGEFLEYYKKHYIKMHGMVHEEEK